MLLYQTAAQVAEVAQLTQIDSLYFLFRIKNPNTYCKLYMMHKNHLEPYMHYIFHSLLQSFLRSISTSIEF